MKVLPLTLHPRLFALLTLGFVLATVVGTVSHEAGHYGVSRALGYDAYLSYASSTTSQLSVADMETLEQMYNANEDKIEAKEDSPEKTRFLKFRKGLYLKSQRPKNHSILILLGGPVQTMLTGLIGFLLLRRWKKRGILTDPLQPRHWLAVFLGFFWSRQFFNFVTSIPGFIKGNLLNGDETRISRYLGMPEGTFGLLTFIPSVLILGSIFFRAIPPQQRLSFLVAGLAGSAFGWFIWMYWLGPLLLPY